MNRIVKFICIFFIVFICLQFSSCDNGKNDKLIYSCGEYTCEIIGITEDVETIIIFSLNSLTSVIPDNVRFSLFSRLAL